jgi:hypothetical protein
MKSNAINTLYFSMYSLNSQAVDSSAKAKPELSPYLKVILSRKGGSGRGTVVRMMNEDRMAAIRYIQESKGRNQK